MIVSWTSRSRAKRSSFSIETSLVPLLWSASQQFSKCRPVVEVLGVADALFSEDLGDMDAMLLRVLLELAVVSCSVAACPRTT
jgi:hypothetical protein